MAITIRRPEGVVELCTDLALRSDWESAVADLDEARKSRSDRLVNSSVAELAERVLALESSMSEVTHVFRLRALPRRRWQELVLEFPARDGNAVDESMGVDHSRFFDAVLMEPGAVFAVVEKVSGEPVDFDPAKDWQGLADEMTDAQWNDFASKVLELNRAVTSVPKSLLASRLMEISAEK